MNLGALILFLALLGGLLAIAIFSYGRQMLLRWLEMPIPPKALAGFAGQTAPAFTDADAAEMLAIDRFDDDGGNQEKRRCEVLVASVLSKTGIRE